MSKSERRTVHFRLPTVFLISQPRVTFDEEASPNLCSAITKALNNPNKLRLFADHERGLFDVSGKMPLVRSSAKRSERLIDMLGQKMLSRVKIKEALQGRVNTGRKFNFAEKARLALSLAWCLVDFIDEDVELAAHSWNPEHIYFLYPEGTTSARKGTLFISLRLKAIAKESSAASEEEMIQDIRPGNPVLLSFARLLLEIYDGDGLSITIHPDNAALNLKAWGQLCDALENAEADGVNHFLSAVHGCLNLRVYLRNEIQKGSPADLGVLRRVMYENIVRNLELAANPEGTMRKAGWSHGETDGRHGRPFKKTSNQISQPRATFVEAPSYVEKRKWLPSPEVRLCKKPRGTTELSKTSSITAAIPPWSATPINAASNALLRSPDTVTLYDDENTGDNPEESKMALTYFRHLQVFKETFILPLVSTGPAPTNNEKLRRPVRVAVLDSGVDMADPYLRGAARRIKKIKNWTDSDPDNWTDTYGHGTHVARLLIRVAPAADIYIARVSTGKHIAPEKTGLIAEVRCNPQSQPPLLVTNS